MLRLNYILCCFLLLGSFFVSAQSLSFQQSAALKTIRTVDDTPVVYQSEVRGGLHQYSVAPWDTIPRLRIYQGMMSVNTSDWMTYRYVSDDFTAGVADHNIESDWERVLLITQHDSSRYYAEGEIVISGNQLYQATLIIDGTVSPVLINDSRWNIIGTDDQYLTVLSLDTGVLSVGLEDGDTLSLNLEDLIGTDDQIIQDFSIDGDTLSITLEDAGTYTVSLDSFREEFRVNDQTVGSPVVVTYNSGGTEIILIDDDFELPTALSQKGATVTVKNVKLPSALETSQVLVSTNGAETIDGSSADVELFRQYDYITLLSDGVSWYKVAEGSTNIAKRNSTLEDEHQDAFYWGNPDETGAWRIVYDESGDNLMIQKRSAVGAWVNKTVIVP